MTSSPELFDLSSFKYDIDFLDNNYELVEDEMTKSYHSFVDQNTKLQRENHRYSILVSSLQSQLKQWQRKCESQASRIIYLQQQFNIQQSTFTTKFDEFLHCANQYDQEKVRQIATLKQEKQLINKKYTDLKIKYENNYKIKYKAWKWLDIYEWIINTINDERLNKYDSILFTALKEQNITGNCLASLHDDDLYYLGIKNDIDRNILTNYIHKLCDINISSSSPASSTPTSTTELTESSDHKHKLLSIQELKNIRIRQENIVYVVGLPVSLCNAKLLKSNKWFGQFGEISRICFNTSPKCVKANSIPTFVTYTNETDALQAIQQMNLFCLADGTRLKTNYGRTKYCPAFCQSIQCTNDKCKFLHQYAKFDDIITQQEINDFNAIRAGPPSHFDHDNR